MLNQPRLPLFSSLAFLYIRKKTFMRLWYCFWNNFKSILSIHGYSNVINKSYNIKQISSDQKYLIWQNFLQSDNSYAFLKAISFFEVVFLMSSKDCVNLNIFAVALLVVWLTSQCIVLTGQCFCLWRSKGPLVLLPARDRSVVTKTRD